MVSSEYCQTMARYNEWMNARLDALCATLPDEELRADRGAFFGSLNATLTTSLTRNLAFLTRFTGDPADAPQLGADLFGSFVALRRERTAIDARIAA